jgi:hypothetical protein
MTGICFETTCLRGANPMGKWGAIAERYDDYGPFSATEDGPSHGVRCLIKTGVVYHGPPPISTGLRGWVKVQTERLRYILPVEDDPIEPESQTLGKLADSLRKRTMEAATVGPEKLPQNDPELARFDWAVSRLLEVAQILAKEGSWLGRVHPENVLLVERSDSSGWELILTEWGFAFNAHVASGDAPAWVTQSPWSLLWDRSPAAMNEWLLNGGRPETKGVDRRTLVRLLACLLVGPTEVKSWCESVPPVRGGGSPLVALPREAGLNSDLWTKLNAALVGEMSLSDLAKYLEQNKPSGCFLDAVAAQRAAARAEQERRRQQQRRRMLIAGVGVPLIGIGLAAGYIIVDWSEILKPPPPPPRLCPECPGSSPLKTGLDELETAQKQGRDLWMATTARQDLTEEELKAREQASNREVAALKALHNRASQDGFKPSGPELECLRRQRDRALDGLGAEFAYREKKFDAHPEPSDSECRVLDSIQQRARAVLDLDPQAVPPDWLLKLKERRKWHCGSSEP